MNSRIPLANVLLLLVLATPSLAPAQQFVRAPMYSAGSPSVSVATADFNGDGYADLAFLNNQAPALINVRLGTEDGTFSTGQQVSVGSFPVSLLAGDWNGDGVPDLAVGLSRANLDTVVAILLGKGDGTFEAQGSIAGSQGINLLASGDLNGDGIADIVVANTDNSVSVLLGLGDGSFGGPVVVGTGLFESTYSVAVADFNQDGKGDIAAVGDDSYDGVSDLVVLLGNGDGTFAGPSYYETTSNSFSNLLVGDFNRDGIPDLADAGDAISIHIGRGDGTFRPPALFDGSTSFILIPNIPRQSLATADVNHDGNPDILSLDYYTNVLDVLPGRGDGSFQERTLFGTGPCPRSLAVADLNHDGNLDVAVPDSCDSNFVALAGDGTGKFLTRRSYFVQVASQPTSVAAGYLDSNQSLDLVVGDLGIGAGGGFYLFLGNNRGAFQRRAVVLVSGGAAWETIADVNRDGKNDVVTADKRNKSVSVFLGNGDGTLQTEQLYATGSGPVFVATADVNGDGRLDLLTANDAGSSFSVLLGSASGFLPHVDYKVKSPVQLALGDFNRDGKLDLITVGRDGTGTVFLGKGDGSYSIKTTLKLSGKLTSVAVGDLNHDGNLDVVIAASSSAVLYSFLGNGDGTFQSPLTSAVPPNVRQVLLADLDSDGKLDAMLVSGRSLAAAAASFLPGKGDGTFRAAQIYTADYAPVAGEAVGDFNADGAPDVVFTNGSGATISLLLNKANH